MVVLLTLEITSGKYTNTTAFGRNVVELEDYKPEDLLLAVGA